MSWQPEKNKHHIVNLDAHSDVRPYEKNNVISSGTPFYRLIQEQGIQGSHYHPFGLQRPSNNPDLVAWMQTHKVNAHWLEDMPTEKQQLKAFQTLLASLKNKKWHFNIDLDAFAVQHAPGVSAQGSFGLTPHLFLQSQKHKQIFKTLETVGIYELAPKYDIDNRTAKLAAKIAYQILSV
ncbi:MAG: arginase family protein [Bdellovibrionota bacterium]